MLVFFDFVERFERFFGIVDIMKGTASFLRAFFEISHRKRRARAGLLFLREKMVLGGLRKSSRGSRCVKEIPGASKGVSESALAGPKVDLARPCAVFRGVLCFRVAGSKRVRGKNEKTRHRLGSVNTMGSAFFTCFCFVF